MKNSFVRFSVVGFSNFIVSYLVFLLAIRLISDTGWGLLFSQTLSYSAGIVWSYIWNRIWTFQSNEKKLPQATRFLASQLGMLALSLLLIHIAVDIVGMSAQIGWFVSMAIVTITNYITMKLWVFSK